MSIHSILVAVIFAAASLQTSAFTVKPFLRSKIVSAAASPTARHVLLTKEETKAIMDRSLECSEGECSVEDVENLMHDLGEQRKVLRERVVDMTKMIDALKEANAAEERPVDEVRETVRAIVRLFLMGDSASGNDYPSLSKPTGWSGDVGDGAKTAYDVLPPKKWKKQP